MERRSTEFFTWVLVLGGVVGSVDLHARRPQSQAPVLMPPALVDPADPVQDNTLARTNPSAGMGAYEPRGQAETVARPRRRSPVLLGLQGVGLAQVPNPSQMFNLGESFVGGRLFSRVSLGGRWYLVPAVGYYHRTQGAIPALQTDHMLELSMSLKFAVFRLGALGLLAGVTQRVGWRFQAGQSGIWGDWQYRVGPAAALNLRLSEGFSVYVGSDLTYPLAQPMRPEWVGHGGVLFAL